MVTMSVNAWKYAVKNAEHHLAAIIRESDLGKKTPKEEWCDCYEELFRHLYFEDIKVYIQLDALWLAIQSGEKEAEKPYKELAAWYGNQFE